MKPFFDIDIIPLFAISEDKFDVNVLDGLMLLSFYIV